MVGLFLFLVRLCIVIARSVPVEVFLVTPGETYIVMKSTSERRGGMAL